MSLAAADEDQGAVEEATTPDADGKREGFLRKVARTVDKGRRWYLESDEPDAAGRWDDAHRRSMRSYIYRRDGGRCGLCTAERDGLVVYRLTGRLHAMERLEVPEGAEVFRPWPRAALAHAHCNLAKGATRDISRWRHSSLPVVVVGVAKSGVRLAVPGPVVLAPADLLDGSARAGACLGSNRREVDLHQRSLGDGGVEVAGAGADPVGGPDSGLHGSPQALLGRRDRRVQLVAVRRTKNQDVDVADSTVGAGAEEACRPGPVDVRSVDVVDAGERCGQDSGRAERLDQHVGQSAVVGAVGVGPHESGVSDLAAGHEAC